MSIYFFVYFSFLSFYFFFSFFSLQLLLPRQARSLWGEKGKAFQINLSFYFLILLSRTAEKLITWWGGGLLGATSRNSTDKRTLIENYDLVSLAIDEIVDDGIILEVDPVVVAGRVTRPPAQDVVGVKGIEFSEQGIMNAWELLKTKGVERIRQF